MEFIKSKLEALSTLAATTIWLFASQYFVGEISRRYSVDNLAQATLILGGVVVILLGIIVYLIYKEAKKESVQKYQEHQPYPGVTVYILKDKAKHEDYSMWFCPHCLLQNGKRGLMQFKPGAGTAECGSCKLAVEFEYQPNA